jgi:hypothetical protein
MHDRGLTVAVINERLREIAIGEIDSSVDSGVDTAIIEHPQAAQDGHSETPAPIVAYH